LFFVPRIRLDESVCPFYYSYGHFNSLILAGSSNFFPSRASAEAAGSILFQSDVSHSTAAGSYQKSAWLPLRPGGDFRTGSNCEVDINQAAAHQELAAVLMKNANMRLASGRA
jgi:hypothetical protein